MIECVTVSSKGQMVIPERMRKKLNIREGTKLVLIQKEDKITLQKEDALLETLEEKDWLELSEESMKEIWDNAIDEKTWRKYL